MQDRKDIWVFLSALIILIPILFFPASSDLSVFMLGGKIIAEGGELYKDYFELKAPLTYYFFAFTHIISNGNIFITRFIELILIFCFLLSSNYILKDFRFPTAIRRIYILLFSLSYVSLNYSNTLQCETITFLPVIWYFYFVIRKNKYSLLLKGVLLGIIIAFKYSLGIIYIAEFFFISNYFNSKRKFLKSKSLEIIIAISILIITFLPTILQNNLAYFNDVLTYLKVYISFPQLNLNFTKAFIVELGSLFGDHYSITFSSAAIIGLLYIVKEKSGFRTEILNVILVFILILIFSFAVERKPTLYQFTRIYPFLLLLSTFGIYYFYKLVGFKNKYIVAIVITFVILLSPLPRAFNLLKIPINYFTQNERYLLNFNNEGGIGNFKSLLILKEYINDKSKNFIFINTGSHQFLDMVNSQYKFPQSAFYLADYQNEKIVKEVLDDIKKLDYIIVQNDDNHYISFFNFDSSYGNLKKKKLLWSELRTNFYQDTIIDNRYLIFKRITSQKFY